jgi:hypothetical protein
VDRDAIAGPKVCSPKRAVGSDRRGWMMVILGILNSCPHRRHLACRRAADGGTRYSRSHPSQRTAMYSAAFMACGYRTIPWKQPCNGGARKKNDPLLSGLYSQPSTD